MNPHTADYDCFICARRACSCLLMPDLSLPSTTSHRQHDWSESYLGDTAPLVPPNEPPTPRLRNGNLQHPVSHTDAIDTNSNYDHGSHLADLSLPVPNVNNHIPTFALHFGTTGSGPEHLYVPSYSSLAQWPLTENPFSNSVDILNFHGVSAGGDNNILLTLHSSGSGVVVQPVGVNQTPHRPEPRCWEHGCSGRLFCSHSNLFRHQRERSGQAPKATCPNCGKGFTRQDGRDKHLLGNKCKWAKQ